MDSVRPHDHGVPEPPWRAARPHRAHRTPLSRDAIVDAAIAVLDEGGADRLSMRRVAARLGVSAASLYWHVPSKSVLIDLILERVIGEAVLPPPDPTHWQEQLKEHGHQWRAILKRHRDLARLTLGRVPMGPNLVRVVEWQLALLRGAALPDRVAAYTGDLLALYVGAHAFEEGLFVEAVAEEGDASDPTVPTTPDFFEMMRAYMLSLPADRFPNTRALVDQLLSGTPSERFEFGLDVIIAGLAALAEEQSPGR